MSVLTMWRFGQKVMLYQAHLSRKCKYVVASQPQLEWLVCVQACIQKCGLRVKCWRHSNRSTDRVGPGEAHNRSTEAHKNFVMFSFILMHSGARFSPTIIATMMFMISAEVESHSLHIEDHFITKTCWHSMYSLLYSKILKLLMFNTSTIR